MAFLILDRSFSLTQPIYRGWFFFISSNNENKRWFWFICPHAALNLSVRTNFNVLESIELNCIRRNLLTYTCIILCSVVVHFYLLPRKSGSVTSFSWICVSIIIHQWTMKRTNQFNEFSFTFHGIVDFQNYYVDNGRTKNIGWNASYRSSSNFYII